jgi:purine catabolism regulatory family protein/PucR-like helix-turn-helix protein
MAHCLRPVGASAIGQLDELDMAPIQWYETPVAITVRQLVETAHIGTHFYAGRAGSEQVINWAHSCEIPDPWDWLEPFDMLMTNGIGLPNRPDEQSRYIDCLADAGISAVAVGEGVAAPEISPAMVSAAERRALPILLTAYEIPFAAVARVVAEARTDAAERHRLLKGARIHQSLRAATIEGRDGTSLLADLGAELACRLRVLDVATWRDVFEPRQRLTTTPRTVLAQTLQRCAGHLPAMLRLEVDGQAAVMVPVPSHRPAALMASSFAEPVPELSVLQQVSTVAALEVERLAARRDALHRAGAELFAGLLAGDFDRAAADAGLRRAGLGGNLVVATWSGPTEQASLHHELYALGLPHLLRAGDRDLLPAALISDDDSSWRLLVSALGKDLSVGLSATITSSDRVRDAAREARRALQAARTDRPVVRYQEYEPALWASALDRSDELAEHVLGRLIEYDRDHRTSLIRTLAVFLQSNRSPKLAAAELFIHRQTLVYRLRRIEALTSRSLSSTEDVVELWLALRALELTDGSRLLSG